MPKILSVDPLFQRAYETLSKEAQRNLREAGLLDPAVLVCYLEGPDTEIEELAREPGDNEKLRELLRQARRAARGQRAEFARRGLDEFVRRDRERKEEARAHETGGPSELQRAAEAPPPWHCRRLPSRLARNTKLEGDSRAREKAEEEERQRWVSEVTDLLITLTGTPTADRAARTTDPKLSAARMCAKVRAATVRSYVRAWRPLWRWWTGTGNNGLPSSPEAVLTYLEQRASEPCAPSVLRRTRAALAFYEEAAGLPSSVRVSKCPWFGKQSDALEATLCGTKKGQAWQTHSAYIAAAEALLVDSQAETVLRCYAFWRCLESWAALRFSDHRGLSPSTCRVTEGAFKAVLTRTKTTGADKKIQSRVLHVDRNCWLLHSDWITVGWKLWEESAPWERDYFLPVPTKSLTHWERYECKYAEATVLSQILEARLIINGEKLLCEGVAGRLWREHSPRAFLTSCTGCLEYPINWQDAIGGWSPGQSQAYVRTTRQRIGSMQSRVARMLRAGNGDALGEKELEEELGVHMVKIGCSEVLAKEQVQRLKRARVFVAKVQGGKEEEEMDWELEKGVVSGEEESLDVSEDEVLDWRKAVVEEVQEESFGTGTHSAEDSKTTVGKEAKSGEFPSNLQDFSHFAKRAKVEQFIPELPGTQKLQLAQLVPEVPGTQKLQLAQLVPDPPGTQELQSAQLVPDLPGTTDAQPLQSKAASAKPERQHRPAGIVETKPRRKRQVQKEQELPVVPPGYLVAFAHKLRCLHYVGRCWRKPGRDIKKWQYYGQEQPGEQEYDHYCKHCWSKGALPGQDSEQARAAEDSGSSSTDA